MKHLGSHRHKKVANSMQIIKYAQIYIWEVITDGLCLYASLHCDHADGNSECSERKETRKYHCSACGVSHQRSVLNIGLRSPTIVRMSRFCRLVWRVPHSKRGVDGLRPNNIRNP